MNKKLRLFLANLALRWAPFGGQKWDSSAKKLEEQLAARGIKLPKKLYYRYALPKNMSPESFMVRVAVTDFCADFSPVSAEARDIWFDKSLTFKEKWTLIRYIQSTRQDVRQEIQEYVKFVLNANPELSKLIIEDDIARYNLLSSVTFGFAPAEIAYYIRRKERDFQQEKRNDETLRVFGIHPNYVLAPETAKMVIAALQQNMQNKNGGRVVI